jgi:hypothetical protein
VEWWDNSLEICSRVTSEISSDQFRRLQTGSMDVSGIEAQYHTHLQELLALSYNESG